MPTTNCDHQPANLLRTGHTYPNLPTTQIRVDYIECPLCREHVSLVRQIDLPEDTPHITTDDPTTDSD